MSVKYMQGTWKNQELTWQDAVLLSGPTKSSMKPDIAVTSTGDVHIVWGEKDQDDGCYVNYCHYDAVKRRCSESQRVDSNPVYINDITPSHVAPRLAMAENEGGPIRLCVAWPGFRNPDDPSPEEDVLLSCSEDGGGTWESPRIMSVFPAGEEEGHRPSIRPSLAFGPSGNLHGAWQQLVDMDEEDYQTYYAHSLNQVFLPLVIRNS